MSLLLHHARRRALAANTYTARFVAAQLARGQVLTPREIAATRTYEFALLAAGLLHPSDPQKSVLQFLYLFTGNTAESHSVNFITPGIYDMGWQGGVSHATHLVTPDGQGGYGDTGYSCLDLTNTNLHLAFYAPTSVADPDRAGQAVAGVGINDKQVLSLGVNRGTRSYLSAFSDPGTASYTDTAARPGFYVGNAYGPVRTISRDGTLLAANPMPPLADEITPVFTIRLGGNGFGTAYSQVPCGLFSGGFGLSDPQLAAFQQATSTYIATR